MNKSTNANIIFLRVNGVCNHCFFKCSCLQHLDHLYTLIPELNIAVNISLALNLEEQGKAKQTLDPRGAFTLECVVITSTIISDAGRSSGYFVSAFIVACCGRDFTRNNIITITNFLQIKTHSPFFNVNNGFAETFNEGHNFMLTHFFRFQAIDQCCYVDSAGVL